LRSVVHGLNPPLVPYLAIYLGDLFLIEEGSRDTVEDGLINMKKRRLQADVVRELMHLQQSP
jgi:son of sevenless-like protein